MHDAERNILRIAHGVPEYGKDVDGDTGALEAVEYAIDRGKGCYPGQEIVERIFTQGSVAQRLAALAAEGEEIPLAPGDPVLSEGRKVGRISSAVHDAAGHRTLVLAYLARGFWGGEKPLAVEKSGAVYPLRVLPALRDKR